MIKLRSIIDEIYKGPLLDLSEANAGYSSTSLHADIAEKIFNAWWELLSDITDKKVPLKTLVDSNKLKKQIDTGINITIPVTNSDIVDFVGDIKIDVLLAIVEEISDQVPINGGGLRPSHPYEIYLKINKNHTTEQAMIHSEYIQDIAYHEAVHVIKEIQKINQLTFKSDVEYTNRDKKFWYKYYTASSELHAHISQICNELKQIKARYSTITFAGALKMSKTYQRYNKDVFSKNPKIKNKILSKISFWWTEKLK